MLGWGSPTENERRKVVTDLLQADGRERINRIGLIK